MILEAGSISLELKKRLTPEIAEELEQKLRLNKAQHKTIQYRNFSVLYVKLLPKVSPDEFNVCIYAHAVRRILYKSIVTEEQKLPTCFSCVWSFAFLDGAWKLKKQVPYAR